MGERDGLVIIIIEQCFEIIMQQQHIPQEFWF